MNEENGVERGIANPVPEMTGKSEPDKFKLPIGSVDLANNLFKEVHLRPISGQVRKVVGRPDILANPGRVVTAALFELCEFPHFKFTDPRQEKKLLCRMMYSGDRAACIMRIRELSKGMQSPIVQASDCPNCGARLQISTLPSDLENIPVSDTAFKYDETAKEWLLTVETSKKNKVRLKLARGFEEEGLTQEQIRNINESAYAILGACTFDINGQKVDQDYWDNQPDVAETDEVLAEFLEHQPGPFTIQQAKCTECQRSFDFSVDPSDFLLPSVGRRQFARRSRRSDH